MRIIVLGSSGFIGKYIVQELTAAGFIVIGIDAIADTSAKWKNFSFIQSLITAPILEKVLKENLVTAIVHAAGKASVPASFADPKADFEENTSSVFTILNSIRTVSPGVKLVLLSSAAVYGNPERLPVLETDKLNPISPYGFHKMQCEMIAQEFYTCFNVNTVVLRIFSCYGAGQRKLFLWDLCNKALAGKEILLKGCGTETRDFVHVSDVASCIHFLIKKEIAGFEIFNLASGTEYSIRDTAVLLTAKIDGGNTINFEGIKNTGNPDNWKADTGKLTQAGFTLQISFEKGIEAYVQWFKDSL